MSSIGRAHKRHRCCFCFALLLLACGAGCRKARDSPIVVSEVNEVNELAIQQKVGEVSAHVDVWNSPLMSTITYRADGVYVNDEAIQRQLPDAMRARDASDFGTLIVVDKQKEEIAHARYSFGQNAYRWRYRVRLIDCDEGAVVGEETFAGDDPPQVISKHSPYGIGDPPVDRIVSWIAGMPSEPPDGMTLKPVKVAAIEQGVSEGKSVTQLEYANAIASLNPLRDLRGQTEFLRHCLGHESEQVVLKALELVNRKHFGGAQVAELVVAQMSNHHPMWREAAISAAIRSESLEPSIREGLEDRVRNDEQLSIRVDAMRGLRQHLPASVETMAWALEDPDLFDEAVDLVVAWPADVGGDKTTLARVHGAWRKQQRMISTMSDEAAVSSMDSARRRDQQLTAWLHARGFETGDPRLIDYRDELMVGRDPDEWIVHKSITLNTIPRESLRNGMAIDDTGRYLAIGSDQRLHYIVDTEFPWNRPGKISFVGEYSVAFLEDENSVVPYPKTDTVGGELYEVQACELKSMEGFAMKVNPVLAEVVPLHEIRSNDLDRPTFEITYAARRSWTTPIREGFGATVSRLSKSKRFAVIGSTVGDIIVINTTDGEIHHELRTVVPSNVDEIAISDNEAWFAIRSGVHVTLIGNRSGNTEVIRPPEIKQVSALAPVEDQRFELAVQTNGVAGVHALEYRLFGETPWKSFVASAPDMETFYVPIDPLPRGRQRMELRSRSDSGGESAIFDYSVDVRHWVSRDLIESRSLSQCELSSNGNWAAATAGQRLVIWDLVDQKQVGPLDMQENVRRIQFSPDGSLLVESGNRLTRVIDSKSGRTIFTDDERLLQQGQRRDRARPPLLTSPTAIAVSSDFLAAFESTPMNRLSVYRITDGHLDRQKAFEIALSDVVTHLEFVPTQSALVASTNSRLLILDLSSKDSGDTRDEVELSDDPILSISCDSDSVVAATRSTLAVFQIVRDDSGVSLHKRRSLAVEGPEVDHVRISTRLGIIAGVTEDAPIRIWRMRTETSGDRMLEQIRPRNLSFTQDRAAFVTFEAARGIRLHWLRFDE